MTAPQRHHLHLDSQEKTEAFAAQLSLFLRPGMSLLLKGDLGAGKSTFARALIRALTPTNEEFEIPSPTFSLMQSYELTRFPVTHIDLYRTKLNTEISELGLADLISNQLLIIEWPPESLEFLGQGQVTLELSGSGNARDLEITATGSCEGPLVRLFAVSNFLAEQGWSMAKRSYLDGDASSRRYERLQRDEMKAILMDMPSRPDGPPVKNGRPYSAIAHLAEGIRSVVAINDELVARGYGAPEILACDIDNGVALIEDLGDTLFGRLRQAKRPMGKPMRAAVEVLAWMASESWPRQVKMRDGSLYHMSAYDEEAQLIEVDLLTAWFFPHVKSQSADHIQVQTFQQIWAKALEATRPHQVIWTLRDFHSPNLIWQPKKTGLSRVGLIDTQDALLGHPAYDLVSLLQDARILIPREEEKDLYEYYCKLRSEASNFNASEFAQAYAILGAQRATKILGIFARLAKRDGKLVYLKHLPLVSGYLNRNLDHPALGELKGWFQTNLPEALQVCQ